MPAKQEFKDTGLLKLLAYALGVAPGEFGLVPDAAGFVSLKELVKAFHEEEATRGLRAGMVEDVVGRLGGGEFMIQDGRIRSLTRQPPPPLPGVQPPAQLYLGLRARAWPEVQKRGLQANQAGPILLAAEKAWALRLGRRRDPEPVLVTVQANFAGEAGVVFAQAGEGLYLCDWLPAKVLSGPRIEERPPAPKPEKKKEKAAAALPPPVHLPTPDQLPGGFTVKVEDVDKPYKRKGLRKEIDWKTDRHKEGRRRDR